MLFVISLSHFMYKLRWHFLIKCPLKAYNSRCDFNLKQEVLSAKPTWGIEGE